MQRLFLVAAVNGLNPAHCHSIEYTDKSKMHIKLSKL